jgi:hypothetical protein
MAAEMQFKVNGASSIPTTGIPHSGLPAQGDVVRLHGSLYEVVEVHPDQPHADGRGRIDHTDLVYVRPTNSAKPSMLDWPVG